MAEIKPEPRINDENSTVHYDINVSKAISIRWESWSFWALTPSREIVCSEAWTLQEGKPYNADYTPEVPCRLYPSSPARRCDINQLSETLDAKDKTVDVK